MKHKKQDVKMQDWKMRHKKFMVGKCEASQYEKRTDTYKSNYYLLKTTGQSIHYLLITHNFCALQQCTKITNNSAE